MLGSPAWLWSLALLAGALLAFGLGRGGAITAQDVTQPRSESGTLTAGGHVVEQSFVPAHDGLSAIEVTGRGSTAPEVVRMTLRAAGQEQAVATAESTYARDGQVVRFEFPPVAGSAGHEYRAAFEARDGQAQAFSDWPWDGYRPGSLRVDGVEQPGADLRFRTEYTLLPATALAALTEPFMSQSGLVVVVVLTALLFAPGIIMLELACSRGGANFFAPPGAWGRGAAAGRLGLALGLSLAFWPLVWLLSPLPWTAQTLPYLIVPLAGVALAFETWPLWRGRRLPPIDLNDIALLLIMLLAFATRALAARDLAFPPWVDSSHHALIVQLFVDNGHVPSSYAPLLDIPRFFYHFGFHALAATFALLTSLPVDRAMLVLGQALNALTALGAYALANWITGHRRAGLVAAFAVAVIAVYPAYYLTWGRFTQLAGLAMLPAAMIVTGEALGWRVPRRRPPPADVVLLGVMSAGLFLVHYRVFAFWVVWLLVALCAGLVRVWFAEGPRAAWRRLGRTALALLLALVLMAPWLWQIARDTLPVMNFSAAFASPAGYNDIPNDYLDRGLERAWLVAGFAAVLIAVLVNRRQVLLRDWRAMATAAWAGLVLVALNLDRVGGPATWMVNNQSWIISLFLPASALLGWAVAALLDWQPLLLDDDPPAHVERLRFAGQWLLLAAAGYLLVVGTWQGIAILNPQTVLAGAEDRAAIDWIGAHTQPGDMFLVNGRPWQTNTWMVPDGGAWITPLTGRPTTLPPIDYGYDAALRERVNAFSSAGSSGALTSGEALRSLNVRYAYVGAQDGSLPLQPFLERPEEWKVAYTNGAVWIFEWTGK